MPSLDIDSMLADISPDAPCGEDLSYDPAYLELQRLAQGTPEQQIGDTVIPAEEPNWREVRQLAAELWGRSRDLRLVLYLTLADLRLQGLPGLAGGLALLQALLERHWDGLYPRLDPDDGNDPTERLNIIAALAAPPETFGDPMMFQRRTLEAPLAESRQLGRYSMRDLLIARGELPAANADGEGAPSEEVISAAFEDTPGEVLQAAAEAADAALASLRAIAKTLDEHVGLGNAPSLRNYESLLAGISKELASRLAARGMGEAPAADPSADGSGDGAAGSVAASGPALSGEIRSSKDVLLALEKICRYYDQAEVSSPVPLFVRAAHKLVSKSFLEIHRVLSSDLVRQLEEVANYGDQSSE